MSTASNARDLGAAIRSARRARGLTQAELATEAGVGRQWLVAVEQGHERAEVGLVTAVLDAVGQSLVTRPAPSDAPDRTWLTAADVAESIRTDLERGDPDFALRALARCLDDLRHLHDPEAIAHLLAEPPSTGDHRWDTLLAASVGWECRQIGIPRPAWTAVTPLRSWWFPVRDAVLVARTMQRTPIHLAVLGIWLDAAALTVL
jgi:y4mF family transcriptional regulator